MINADFDEAKQSQLLAVELLVNMGYIYISREQVQHERRGDMSKFLLKNIAFEKLRDLNSFEFHGGIHKFSDKNIVDAIDELENIPLEGLMDTSKEIYNMIMTLGGKTIKEFVDGVGTSHNFKFIDFEHPERNVFHVTVEYKAEGRSVIRPDIVCFVNGIPFVVIENKKSATDITEALSQMNRNQQIEYCPRLYAYTQLLIGTNSKSFLYGTTGTPNKFYVGWKEKGTVESIYFDKIHQYIHKALDKNLYKVICDDLNGATYAHEQIVDRMITEQDKGIVSLLEPTRLLQLTKNFILYDAGIKKVPRYQQFFAINKMLERISEEEEGPRGTRRRGGLVWHTQGSGKSLTMVMFVKALIEHPHIHNPRVIIVTDRVDLDKQIAGTFKDCNLKKEVLPVLTGKHLLELIRKKNPAVITCLVQKFESARKNREDFVDTDKNIFVLIDEAHRTQGGIANAEMNMTIPNACLIAFTGTPLMKKEKNSEEKFGGYIDKYTIDDALEDGVILPLIYEGRYTEMTQNKEKIDAHTERFTRDMTQEEKKNLQKFIDTKVIKSNPQRIAQIAYDVEEHFQEYVQGSGLKAQLVAPSKYSAILFQKIFEESGRIKTAVVISETAMEENEGDSHKKEVAEFLSKMTAQYKSLKSYEEAVVESFKNNPDGIEIIIVVDKLLTGFDAPRNTVLYLTKDLKDHNLLQAIARVNRLFENDYTSYPKTKGYIIDYSENAKNIDSAMKLFGNFDEEDVKRSLIDVKDKVKDLENSFDTVQEIFKSLGNTRDDQAYLEHLSDEQQRDAFYTSINDFLRNFNECLALRDFAHHFPHLDTYKKELKKMIALRSTVRLRYADKRNFDEYKKQLVKILDQYVDADEVELLTKQININDRHAFSEAVASLGSDKSKAEAIGAQLERTITEKMSSDPVFYQKFSEKIADILQKLKEGKLADIEALTHMKLISDEVLEKHDKKLPDEIAARKGADVLYRNVKEILDKYHFTEESKTHIILNMYDLLLSEMIVDWYKNSEVKRVIANKLDDYLYDYVKIELGVEVSAEDMKKIIDITMELAAINHILFV